MTIEVNVFSTSNSTHAKTRLIGLFHCQYCISFVHVQYLTCTKEHVSACEFPVPISLESLQFHIVDNLGDTSIAVCRNASNGILLANFKESPSYDASGIEASLSLFDFPVVGSLNYAAE